MATKWTIRDVIEVQDDLIARVVIAESDRGYKVRKIWHDGSIESVCCAEYVQAQAYADAAVQTINDCR